jgi:glycine betaine catabolism A
MTSGHGLDPRQLALAIDDFGQSRTLPAAAYTDPAVLDWEMENIFKGTWVCVGRFDELPSPGQIRAIEVAGEGVLLTRDDDDRLAAFSNVCRHRGHELAPVGAPIDARLIRCPYHAWSYRFDGSLRAAPTFAQTPGFDMSEWPLVPVRATVYGGWVWVDLSGGAPDIASTSGTWARSSPPTSPIGSGPQSSTST